MSTASTASQNIRDAANDTIREAREGKAATVEKSFNVVGRGVAFDFGEQVGGGVFIEHFSNRHSALSQPALGIDLAKERGKHPFYFHNALLKRTVILRSK